MSTSTPFVSQVTHQRPSLPLPRRISTRKMSLQQAFLSPIIPFARVVSLNLTSPRRPARRAPLYRACLPSDDDENRPFQFKTSSREPKPPTSNDDFEDPDATFTELDELAEEWIGANLARWEWYERMKSRRQRMLCVVRRREQELNQEFEELRRTFMEFDALFGTRMLDDQSSISPAGWGTVGVIMLAYVTFGYWLFEFVVKTCTDYAPGFPL